MLWNGQDLPRFSGEILVLQKKQCNFDSVWLEQQPGGFLNLVNLTDLLGIGTKLKESIFKNNQINSTVTTRT